MGSSPSSEVKSQDVPQRRIVSVPNIRENSRNNQPQTSTNDRSFSKQEKQPNQNQKPAPAKDQSAPKVIRGGNAQSIPEINHNDEIVFETFYHKSGKNYTCMFTNNVRYYLDSFNNGEWKEFPVKWYDEGTLDIDDILGSGQQDNGQTNNVQVEVVEQKPKDNREGIIKIPGKGVFQTYIFEHRRNVHCYFDPDEGSWIKLPLKWELKTDIAKKLVRNVQESCPQWQDECDLLASLRASNYNVEDAVNTFLVTEGTYGSNVAAGFEGSLSREKSIIVQNDSIDSLSTKLSKLQKEVDNKTIQIKKVQTENDFLKSKTESLEDKLATTIAELSAALATSESIKRDRPVTGKSKTAVVEVAKETVSPESLKKLYTSVTDLHKLQIKLIGENKSFKAEFGAQIEDTKKAFAQLRQTSSATTEEIEEVRRLYRREVIQRKMLYNSLQEARGNIRVFCRVRNDPSATSCLSFPDEQDVCVVTTGGKKLFQFDRSFDKDAKQEEVFEQVNPIITSCADGYNVSIMAYGQTGSGKTYTMIGPMPNPFSNPGVNIRAIRELFKLCNGRKETVEYTMHISMLEIYNENIQDLLSKDVKTIELRAVGNKVTLPDVTEIPVSKEKDIIDVMDMGTANRKVASTKMNSQSSRSHLILILTVIGQDKITGTTSKGTLTLADLAGSERVSKTEATGPRLAEAAFINKSLTSLGQVFAALRDNQLHVPYRNSKLTHILMPSLGGDAKACLFVNVSSSTDNMQETLSTLLFGVNARQVALGQAKKNVSK